jgi:ABC-2 type transport system ATP-binding protein
LPVRSDIIVQTRNLTKIFWKKSSEGRRFSRKKKEKVVAVDHIDLEIKRGELFGLLGPNGAGKTTTIKMLCTLLVPDEGTAAVDGLDVVKDADEVRKKLGVVLGGERALYWRLSGYENMWFFSQMYNVPPGVAKKRIEQLLKLVELDKSAHDMVEKYSRGMKARLHLARGLVNDPDILLLDEPTLGIDPSGARMLRDFIKNELQRKRGKTMLLTTHYMQEADELCDRVAIIDKGKIIALDTPKSLKESISEVEVAEVFVEGAHPGIEDRLKGIAGVDSVTADYADSTIGEATIRLQAKKLERILPSVTKSLVDEDIRIKELKESKPSLEDVYIKLTGKKLRD